MSARRIHELLRQVDGTGSHDELEAVRSLEKTTEGLAYWLLDRYRTSSSWKVRRNCVYYACRARESEHAFTLARAAIRDRSKVVRYRAFELLAWIQRRDVLPELRDVLASIRNGPESKDVRAAIDALENRNRHYFLDREHTGKVLTYTADEFIALIEAGRTPPAISRSHRRAAPGRRRAKPRGPVGRRE
jgi:hypothetical protein